MDTGQHPSILLWVSVFPHSFFIPVVDALQRAHCEILCTWTKSCLHKAVLAKAPPSAIHPLCISQPSCTTQTTFINWLHPSGGSLVFMPWTWSSSHYLPAPVPAPGLFGADHHNSSLIKSHLGKDEPNYSYCFLFSLCIKEKKPKIVLYPEKKTPKHNKLFIEGENEKGL